MQSKILSTRRVKIDKAYATTLVIIGVASFVTIFSLFASKALISQYLYQQKVTQKQQITLTQLSADNQAATSLISSYQTFVNQSTNIIGGSATGSGSQDGPNGRIILDALPDAYDFPALATSIVKILSNAGVTIEGITGSDTSGDSTTSPTSLAPSLVPVSVAVAPIPIPFTVSVTGTFDSDQNAIKTLLSSIRPMQIQSISLTGTDNALAMTVAVQTYYQLPQGLSISTEAIK